jgi:hypothetical protein
MVARAHVQVAERIGWMVRAHELPEFQRYPPQNRLPLHNENVKNVTVGATLHAVKMATGGVCSAHWFHR